MEHMASDDRRATTRSAVALRADIREEGAARACKLSDLSLDGAFVRGEVAAPGTVIPLSLALGDGEPALRARALVVRGTQEGVGVRFLGMRTKEMVRIAEELFGG